MGQRLGVQPEEPRRFGGHVEQRDVIGLLGERLAGQAQGKVARAALAQLGGRSGPGVFDELLIPSGARRVVGELGVGRARLGGE